MKYLHKVTSRPENGQFFTIGKFLRRDVWVWDNPIEFIIACKEPEVKREEYEHHDSSL